MYTSKVIFSSFLLLIGSVCWASSNEVQATPVQDVAATPEQADAVSSDNPLMTVLDDPRYGDLPQLLAHREIRVLVTPNRTDYLVEKGRQTGIIYDTLVALEAQLNQKYNKGKSKRHRLPYRIVVIPVSEEQLIPYLLQGFGDVAAAALTDNPEGRKLIDYTTPFYDEAKEIVVTHKGMVVAKSEQELSGSRIVVRRSSNAYKTLIELNERLKNAALAPVDIQVADEHLSDDELMEMVNAQLIPATVTNLYRAKLWNQIFKNLVVNETYTLRDHGKIVWALRKNSPQLKQFMDSFIASHKVGTNYGNQLKKHYFVQSTFAKNAIDSDGRARFGALSNMFQKYGGQYDFDYLLLMAQGYQESGLNQNARSHVGAIGVMQVMPQTGKELHVGDIHKTDPNIHAGTKYIHLMRDKYFNSPEIDGVNQMYFSFAAYNAGPGNVIKMRKLAKKQGLDPNVWFDNVELVMLQHIGREPVQYVSNISKYYLAYKMLEREGSGAPSNVH